MQNIDRNTLYLMLAVFGAGVVAGVLLAPKGGRNIDHSRNDDHKRTPANLVFGNIVIGSNNAPDAVMTFGQEDSGDNR